MSSQITFADSLCLQPHERSVIIVYTDGASRGNPGPGGAGIILLSGKWRKEISLFLGEVTNNIAELTAIRVALEKIKRRDLPVYLHTDSEYAIGVLNGRYKIRKNQELIAGIKKLMRQFSKIVLVKVTGHAGVAENEKADYLASHAADSGENRETLINGQ
jgi:ribonuclease HI